MRILFVSACVVLSMDGRHLTIRAFDAPIDDRSIDGMFATTEALLEERTPFTSTWDVRECRVPSAAVTWRCIRWAMEHKRALNEYNEELTVYCDARLIHVVRLVLRAFGPTCPTRVES